MSLIERAQHGTGPAAHVARDGYAVHRHDPPRGMLETIMGRWYATPAYEGLEAAPARVVSCSSRNRTVCLEIRPGVFESLKVWDVAYWWKR